MTPPTLPNKGFKIGFRYVSFFQLNTYQTPLAASSTVGYEGLQYESARTLTVNNAQPRIISQVGDDKVEALQVLPPATGMDADLHVGMANLDVLAVLTGAKVDTLGLSTRWIPMQTNKRGFEPYLGILAYSASNEVPTGEGSWDWYFFPYAKAVWLASGNAETPQDEIFKIVPNYTSLTPWGVALVDATNGALSQQAIKGKSTGIPHLCAFLAAGTESDYVLPALAYDETAVTVFVNDTLDSTAGVVNTSVTTVTPTTKPSSNDRIVIWYEE
jgi:hypothetical protein